MVSRFDDLGPNSGLAEELTSATSRTRPRSTTHWRDVLRPPAGRPPTADGPGCSRAAPAAPAAAAAPSAAPAAPPRPRLPPRRDPGPLVLEGDEPEPLRGAAARIVENMEASLEVPTATSVRVVPAKLLEVNRQILNNQLARTGARQGQLHAPHRATRCCARSTTFPGAELRLRAPTTASPSSSATST